MSEKNPKGEKKPEIIWVRARVANLQGGKVFVEWEDKDKFYQFPSGLPGAWIDVSEVRGATRELKVGSLVMASRAKAFTAPPRYERAAVRRGDAINRIGNLRSVYAGGAFYKHETKNAKLGDGCDATYVWLGTCPHDCPLRGEMGCYAELANMATHTERLMKLAVEKYKDFDPSKPLTDEMAYQVALDEAKCMDESWFGGGIPGYSRTQPRLLRMHVSGDCLIEEGAAVLGAAASRWVRRSGGKVWTYTHGWRTVNRAAWGKDISVLASVHTHEEARAARERGYAPAVTVNRFLEQEGPILPKQERHEALLPSNAPYLSGGVRVIPCPSQTGGITCRDCQACMKADLLFRKGEGIAFSLHGAKAYTSIAQGIGVDFSPYDRGFAEVEVEKAKAKQLKLVTLGKKRREAEELEELDVHDRHAIVRKAGQVPHIPLRGGRKALLHPSADAMRAYRKLRWPKVTRFRAQAPDAFHFPDFKTMSKEETMAFARVLFVGR